jgi:hypothetical protein
LRGLELLRLQWGKPFALGAVRQCLTQKPQGRRKPSVQCRLRHSRLAPKLRGAPLAANQTSLASYATGNVAGGAVVHPGFLPLGFLVRPFELRIRACLRPSFRLWLHARPSPTIAEFVYKY